MARLFTPKMGVSNTNKVKTSKRLNNIVTTKIHFPVGFIDVKLSATVPRPGPKLLSVVAIAENAENSSTPVAINNNKLTTKTSA